MFSDAEVFGFVKQRRALRQPGADKSNLIADLTPGDYVVHLEHGIARFEGLIVRNVEDVQREFLQLAYAQGDKLFVPVDQSDRVARYVGPGEFKPDADAPGLGRMGARAGPRAAGRGGYRARPAGAVRRAQLQEGHAFSPDTPWQQRARGGVPVRRDARPARRPSATSSTTWRSRGRWTA